MIRAKEPRLQRISAAYLFGNASLYELVTAIAGEARSGETTQIGSTGTASTRACKASPENPSGTVSKAA